MTVEHTIQLDELLNCGVKYLAALESSLFDHSCMFDELFRCSA